MKAVSIRGNSANEIKSELAKSMAGGFKPTLAIVFLPVDVDINGVSELFEKKGIAVFGASSYGHFIDKNYEKDSIVAMLLDIDPKYFRLVIRETGNSTTKQVAALIGEEGKSTFANPSFIVASGGIKTDGDMVVQGLLEGTGKPSSIFGCRAGSDLNMIKTFVFTNGKISEDGIIAIILDDEKINVKGLAVGGWQPVGMFRTITKSEGNVVYTFDDLPALDTVLRYSGANMSQLRNEGDILRLASVFQLQLHRENANPIMRTPMYANFDDKSVVFAGSVPQGSKVKFSLLPGFEVIDNLISEYTAYQKQINSADAMVLFSCKGRELALGPWIGEEIERIQQIWDSPLVGSFTFGEIGCDKNGNSEFYNMTCSLVLLNEI